MITLELLTSLRHPVFNTNITADEAVGYCFACGEDSTYDFEEIIHDDLARQWGVTDRQRHAYSSRESRQCKHCGCTFRNRQLARALVLEYGKRINVRSLKELVGTKDFQDLNFAEINACGGSHQFFAQHPRIHFSEFDSKDPNVPSEDLHSLSYQSNVFDLVVTSDTLEHIPNYEKAFQEISRILRMNGKHIFTIPVIWKIKTRRRAEFNKSGKGVKHLVEPAYHGPDAEDNLVWTDFGYDVLDILRGCGFDTKVYYYNLLNSDDAGCVLVSTKIE